MLSIPQEYELVNLKSTWKKLCKSPIFFLKMAIMCKKKSHFVPGRPRTEGFVPGHLLLPLSRDKGTPGQGKCPCPGTKGQRESPVPWKRYSELHNKPATGFAFSDFFLKLHNPLLNHLLTNSLIFCEI